MLIFKHMCVASDGRTIVFGMLLFVENEYKICITFRSLGVSGVTRNYLILPYMHLYTFVKYHIKNVFLTNVLAFEIFLPSDKTN